MRIGISPKGKNAYEIGEFPEFNHLLIIFGGLHGLEDNLECDDIEYSSPEDLFDLYLNPVPSSGSHVVRTEVWDFIFDFDSMESTKFHH